MNHPIEGGVITKMGCLNIEGKKIDYTEKYFVQR